MNNRGCQAKDMKNQKCSRLSNQIHHRKGRGKHLNIVASWMAVCHICHERIERNRIWAKNEGYLLSRFSSKPSTPLDQS